MTPTPDALVERARALRPRLRELQAEHARAGGYGAEIHEALRAGGLYRVLAPRRFGGAEASLETFLRVAVEIARGDPAVGWSYALTAARSFHVASYLGEEAQAALFADDLIAPARVMPTGRATPVDGGHRLSGTWAYCSGSTWSTHVLLAATTTTPGEVRFFTVPRCDYAVLDDWDDEQVIGMAASGSNSVRVDDAFVPDAYSFPAALMLVGPKTPEQSPGYRLHGHPRFTGRTQMLFAAELVASQVGAARAALDELEELMRTRTTSRPPFTRWIDSEIHLERFGTAVALTDSAEALLRAAARRHEELSAEWAAGGAVFGTAEDLRLQATVLRAGRSADQAIDIALMTAGTGATRRGSRLARYHADATVYRTHVLAQADHAAVRTARAVLGAPRAEP